MDDVYSHGHHEAVLRSHRWRNAENSCSYLLDHLRPGMTLLDVGCGPGTISADLARRVAPGRVVGVDREPMVVAEAAAQFPAVEFPGLGFPGLEFRAGDVYRLEIDDDSFDVVHAHQVLQHLTDPIAALREMKRVLRPSGLLAVRDSDYGAFVWFPPDARLSRWREIYAGVTRHNGANSDAGRHLPGWVRSAGFHDVVTTSSTWTFADDSSRRWWADNWAERTTASSFAEQALTYGLSTPDELEDIAQAWREWSLHHDGLFVAVHVEVLAR